MLKRLFLLTILPALAISALASPIKSNEAANGVSYTEDPVSPNPYVSAGLVAMWDAEWNVGYGEHDAESDVWVDLVGNNHMLLNPASTWGDQCLNNAPNTKGAVAQYWADGAVTIEVVMRVRGYTSMTNNIFVVYNKLNNNTYRGIGKRFEWFTNGVKHYYSAFKCKRTDLLQVSFYLGNTWTDCYSYLDAQLQSLTRTVDNIHTIDENAVYVNAGRYEVEYYTIRLYNRELTEAERLHNYEVDRLRFNLP